MSDTYDPEKRFNDRAKVYDDEIDRIIPGYRALHDISHHILKSSLPRNAHILIGGSGTGKESIEYALENPEWRIVGFDIAEQMVEKATSKIKQEGLQSRIELIHGGINDILQQDFDGATSLLVAHFIPLKEKEDFIKEIYFRLKPGAKFIIADVSKDENTHRFEELISTWMSFQLQTRDQKDVEEMLGHVRNNLHYITPEETVSLLESSGFINILHFWKSLLVNGFVAQKPF